MNHVTDETLAAIALGEPDVDPAARDHVDGCPVCSLEVAELEQVDHLMRVEAASGESGRVRLEPSPGLWERIAAETSDRPESPTEDDRTPGVAAATTVDEPGDDAPVVPIGSAPSRAVSPPRRRAGWIIAAAAACVLAGALLGRALWTGATPDASTQVVATTSLTTLDAAHRQEGTAQLLEAKGVRELRVDATTMPALASGFVEVWLINTDGQRMVSLGVMATPQAVFPVPAGAIEQGYTTVDLSHEQFDNQPQHSGDSLMRGSLPA